MNIEAYGYTALSAFLGISIVFIFLGFLCIFMVIIKRLFDDRPVKEAIAVALSTAAKSDEVVQEAPARDTDWITAAVAVYLEEEDLPKSALSWLPDEKENTDPWVVVPRVQKTFSGV